MDEFYSRATLKQVEEQRQKEKEQRRTEEERRLAGKEGGGSSGNAAGGGGQRDRDRGRRWEERSACVRALSGAACIFGTRWRGSILFVNRESFRCARGPQS